MSTPPDPVAALRAALSTDRLEHPLVDLLREQGADTAGVPCPGTASVTVSKGTLVVVEV